MRIEKKKHDLVPTHFLKFVEDIVLPEKSTTLHVMARDAPKHSIFLVKFLVVKCLSVYNVIISRPFMNNMKAITSTNHLTMKFSTEDGVGVVCKGQYKAKKCYTIAIENKDNQTMHITSRDDNEEMDGVPSIGMPRIGTLILCIPNIDTPRVGTYSTGTLSIGMCNASASSTGTSILIGTPCLDTHIYTPNLSTLCDVIQKVVQSNGDL